MKKIYTTVLFSALLLLLTLPTFAQDFDFSHEQIIGKWNLKSARFNGEDVLFHSMEQALSFEFTNTGQVTLIKSDGFIEKGKYVIEDNLLIDPESPEYLNAHIITLANDELILSMYEDRNEVLMIFELEGYASK